MDDLPTKSKRRAVRRKRNLIAKEVRQNKIYRPKVVDVKRVRNKLRVRDIEMYLEEEMIKEA